MSIKFKDQKRISFAVPHKVGLRLIQVKEGMGVDLFKVLKIKRGLASLFLTKLRFENKKASKSKKQALCFSCFFIYS